MVAGMQLGKAAPALPALRAEFALDLIAAGFIASAFNAIAAALGIAGGGVVDRFGHRRVLIAGLLTLAVGAALGGFADRASWLLGSRLIEGMGFVAIVVAAPSLIALAADPRHQRLALGMWGTYMPAGMALIIAAAPLLLGTVGWRALWQGNAALVLVVLGALVWATRGGVGAIEAVRPPAAAPAFTRRSVIRTVTRPGPWLLGACFAAYTLQWIAVMAWLPTFLIEEQGRSLLESSLLTALVIAVNIVGNLAGGWLLHRNVPRWLLIALANGGMGLLALGILSATLPDLVKYLMALAFSGFGGILPASVLSGAPVHAPSPGLIGVTNGVIVQGANLGSLAGPPALAALVTGAGGWQGGSWLLLVAGLLGVALALALRAVERRL